MLFAGRVSDANARPAGGAADPTDDAGFTPALGAGGWSLAPQLRKQRCDVSFAAMLDPCCEMMGLFGRDHWKGVPESDLPDAIIELHPLVGAAILKTATDVFDCYIQHCPWCGAKIGEHPFDLPKDFDPSA